MPLKDLTKFNSYNYQFMINIARKDFNQLFIIGFPKALSVSLWHILMYIFFIGGLYPDILQYVIIHSIHESLL